MSGNQTKHSSTLKELTAIGWLLSGAAWLVQSLMQIHVFGKLVLHFNSDNWGAMAAMAAAFSGFIQFRIQWRESIPGGTRANRADNLKDLAENDPEFRAALIAWLQQGNDSALQEQK